VTRFLYCILHEINEANVQSFLSHDLF